MCEARGPGSSPLDMLLSEVSKVYLLQDIQKSTGSYHKLPNRLTKELRSYGQTKKVNVKHISVCEAGVS